MCLKHKHGFGNFGCLGSWRMSLAAETAFCQRVKAVSELLQPPELCSSSSPNTSASPAAQGCAGMNPWDVTHRGTAFPKAWGFKCQPGWLKKSVSVSPLMEHFLLPFLIFLIKKEAEFTVVSPGISDSRLSPCYFTVCNLPQRFWPQL